MTRSKRLFATLCAVGALLGSLGSAVAQFQLPFALPWSTGSVPAPAPAQAPKPASPSDWSGQPGSSGHPLMTTEAILAAAGNFEWNVILSSVGRLFIYGITCAALPVLRRKHGNAPAFRLPAGNVIAVLGILFMLALLSRAGRSEGTVILATMAIALANWLWARNRQDETL